MAMPAAASPARPTGRRLGQQGALLLGGFVVAQACSFLRNAIIGHTLSRGDFGVAATITIALQLLETLSDLGADRLLVQAADGDDPRLMATAHTTLVARGLLTAALLLAGAGPIAAFFAIPHAAPAFALAAAVPLIKGFMHLDSRRQQRALSNRNYILIEVVPQLAALLAVVPALRLTGDYAAVVWVALIQALLTVLASHLLAGRSYRLAAGRDHLRRLIAFGWPIWLSAFPLVLVYQGDRIMVGRLIGMDAVAGYSAAFMVAMVPGLLAAKIAHALCLPLLAAVTTEPRAFWRRYVAMFEAAAVVAAMFVGGFVIAGGAVMPKAFGPSYVNLGGVTGWLGAMWALRMIQSIPGMALMARGETRPLLVASIIRAGALVLAYAAIVGGFGIAGAAAAGAVGELLSLGYVLVRTAGSEGGVLRATALRSAYPVAAGLAAVLVAHAWLVAHASPVTASLAIALPAALLLCAAVALIGIAAMPALRGMLGERSGPEVEPSAAPTQP